MGDAPEVRGGRPPRRDCGPRTPSNGARWPRYARRCAPEVCPSPSSRPTSWTVAAGDSHWTVDRAGHPTETIRGDCNRVVTVLEFRGVQAILEEAPDVLTLHAALVSRDDRGLLILGPGQSGKSTLASALWRHGFDFLGDDLAIVDPDSRLGSAAPRRVSLRTPSRALLGESLWSRIVASPSHALTPEGCVFHPHEVDGHRPRASVSLVGCVFLSRRPGRHTGGGVLAVPPGDAVLATALCSPEVIIR